VASALTVQIGRLKRSLATVACVSGYGLFCWLSIELGELETSLGAMSVLAGVVLLGIAIAGVALAADLERGIDKPALTFAQAVWGNAGLAVTSLVVSGALQVLLLVATLLGITFAALHLKRAQVAWLTALTWVVYSTGLLWTLNATVPDASLDLLIWLGYSLSLAGVVLVAGEVAGLRTALEARTSELETTLGRLHDLAMRDDLTGLYNRRQLMEYLQRQKALSDRGSLGFTLCYVDLDHFKRVNDRFGHTRGDEVLKAFAQIAERAVREEDFVARIGGEEFVLVLINASVRDAEQVAQRLRRQTQMMIIDPRQPTFAVTASVGIAAYRPRELVEQLLARADTAMYAAKTQGRNRVVIAPGIEISDIPNLVGR
jgi:diguanylate cyclase (GGDEF)-like protein